MDFGFRSSSLFIWTVDKDANGAAFTPTVEKKILQINEII